MGEHEEKRDYEIYFFMFSHLSFKGSFEGGK